MTIDGAKIRRLRDSRGYSLVKLAEIAGLSKNTIHELENNRSVPTLETINKLAKALAVEPQELFLGGE